MVRKHDDDNIYAEGSVIFAKERPTTPMVIRCYLDKIYYCRNQDKPDENERVYFEPQLLVPSPPKI
jgi:hypothetical protein